PRTCRGPPQPNRHRGGGRKRAPAVNERKGQVPLWRSSIPESSLWSLMTPAAYHRLAELTFISKSFVKRAGQLIAVAMLALTLGIGLDIDVITRLITHNQAAATIIALACGAVFAGLLVCLSRLARDSK